MQERELETSPVCSGRPVLSTKHLGSFKCLEKNIVRDGEEKERRKEGRKGGRLLSPSVGGTICCLGDPGLWKK